MVLIPLPLETHPDGDNRFTNAERSLQIPIKEALSRRGIFVGVNIWGYFEHRPGQHGVWPYPTTEQETVEVSLFYGEDSVMRFLTRRQDIGTAELTSKILLLL